MRDMQTELAHVNRVTTMGQMSASIAHEVNQPIAATVTNAQAALRWLRARPPDLDEVRASLSRIVEDGKRAGNVISGIRTLVKKLPPRKDRFDLNEAILEMVALTRSEVLNHGILLQTELAPGLTAVDGDRIQLQQVILNLIINAVEAMGGIGEGTRELRINTREGGRAAACSSRCANPGPGLDPRIPSAFSRPSTPRSPRAWAWASRSAGRSSRRTGDGCGQARMNLAAPSFNLPCRGNEMRAFQPGTYGPIRPRERAGLLHAPGAAMQRKLEPLVSSFTELALEMR